MGPNVCLNHCHACSFAVLVDHRRQAERGLCETERNSMGDAAGGCRGGGGRRVAFPPGRVCPDGGGRRSAVGRGAGGPRARRHPRPRTVHRQPQLGAGRDRVRRRERDERALDER